MLLAAGVYPRFIEAIGDVTRGRLRRGSLMLLGVVVVAALAAIFGLAGVVKQLVVDQRWAMYALFIGLTLGGVPVVWRLISAAGGARSKATWAGAAGGLIAMVTLAIVQATGGAGGDSGGWLWLLIAGIAGASAMILPGVSGAYLLLVLGVYVPILSGLSELKDAVGERDVAAMTQLALTLVLPVGLGVVVGVVGVSNVLRWLLHRYERATLGVLLGLLVGAVAGLQPFQAGVEPAAGDELKGQVLVADEAGQLVYSDTGKVVEAEDWLPRPYRPDAVQVAGAAGLVLLGFAITMGIDWIGRRGEVTKARAADGASGVSGASAASGAADAAG
jgi:putative membrane protein